MQEALLTLKVERRIKASPEQLFLAWTTPEFLAQWFAPTGFEVIEASVDLTVGGAYSISIINSDQEVTKHFGTYIKITSPSELVFTWELENQQCQGSIGQCATTLVTVTFKADNDTTLVSITHEQLPTQESFDGHQFGWNGCLDTLEKVIAQI
ncbi:MAG: SRPBCC domain-containing protein [Kangiellaceae bacterium]|nr:SRPBCC domain-containing protein [Kangiellaceae bacterium]